MSEIRFTNNEVKERYYEALKESGITHISWNLDMISEKNIDEIIETIKDTANQINDKQKKVGYETKR